MELPLVSVICLSYNQERFISEAIASVFRQTYSNIEVIAVDDGSTDGSAMILDQLKTKYPSIKVLKLEKNIGNCAAFNRGLAMSKGKYLIDFAADDVMLPDKVEQQVSLFNKLDNSYGVIFTDALYIDTNGQPIRKHFESLFRKGLLKTVPRGDVYKDVLSAFFIASPTMMVTREVFEQLGGYDESLSYEDFDFWVRSARVFKYEFLNKVTIHIRKSANSMSTRAYTAGDRQLFSTWVVCKKAMQLNRTEEERQALIKRVQFEIRQSVFSENREEARLFFELLKELSRTPILYKILILLNAMKLPLRSLRTLYHRIRFGEF